MSPFHPPFFSFLFLKDTFDRARAAYLRTDKLRRAMADTRDGLLKFVKENAPKQR